MKPRTVLATAAVVLLAAALIVWRVETPRRAPHSAPPRAAQTQPRAAPSADPASATPAHVLPRELVAARAVTGTVTDRTGRPIAGARVVALPSGAADAVDFERATNSVAATDDAGRFAIEPPVTAAAVDLVASASGFAAGLRESTRIGEDVTVALDHAFALVGAVMDRLGKPIPGAAVRWFGWVGVSRLRRETTSGDDGSYRLADLPESRTNNAEWQFGRDETSFVDVRADGFAPLVVGATEWLRPNRPRGDVAVDLVLVRGATVRGRVQDGETGAPIAGARVIAWQGGGDHRVGRAASSVSDADTVRTCAEAVSATDGSFELSRLPAASLYADVHDALDELHSSAGSIIAVADGYVPAAANWRLEADGAVFDVDLRCWPFGTVTGRVVDASGAPVADALVWAEGIGQQQGWAPPAIAGEDWQSGETDAVGRYTLRVDASRGPGGSSLDIRASSPNFAAPMSSVEGVVSAQVLVGQLAVAPDIILVPREPSVCVTVMDDTGKPVARADVTRPADLHTSTESHVETDSNGCVRVFFSRVDDDRLHQALVVRAAGFAPAVTRSFLPSVDDPPLVTVTLVPGRTLRGRVVYSDGPPAQGALVRVENPQDVADRRLVETTARSEHEVLLARGTYGETVSAEDGSFEVRDLPDGSWQVMAAPGPWWNGDGLVRTDVPSDADSIVVTLRGPEPRASVECTLTDAATNEPVLPFNALLDGPGRVFIAERVEPGRCRFPRVTSGVWVLQVRAPGYLPLERTVVVPGQEANGTPIALRLDRGSIARGVVRGMTDVEHALIVFRRTDDRTGGDVGQVGEPWSRVARNGSYVVSGLAPGTYEPLVRTFDWGVQEKLLGPSPAVVLVVPPGGRELTFDVTVGATQWVAIVVKSSRLTAHDATFARIDVVDARGGIVWSVAPITNESPFTAFLPIGNYTARLTIAGASSQEKNFSVQDDGAEVTFDVP